MVQGICVSIQGMSFPNKHYMHIRQKWFKRTKIVLVYYLCVQIAVNLDLLAQLD